MPHSKKEYDWQGSGFDQGATTKHLNIMAVAFFQSYHKSHP